MTYLVCGSHEDIVGDFAEGKAQVNNIVLGAAALGEVTDVDDAPRTRLPRHKLQVGGRRTDFRDSLILRYGFWKISLGLEL